jgi:hypothetical protein
MTHRRRKENVDGQASLWPYPLTSMNERMASQAAFAECRSQHRGSHSASNLEPRQLQNGEGERSPSDGVCVTTDAVSLCRSFWSDAFDRTFAAMRGVLPAWRVKAMWNDVRAAASGACGDVTEAPGDSQRAVQADCFDAHRQPHHAGTHTWCTLTAEHHDP